MFSTLGHIIEYTGGIQYTKGYHEYTRGCSVQWGDTMSIAGGYHDECGDIMSILWDVQYTGVSIQIKLFSQ